MRKRVKTNDKSKYLGVSQIAEIFAVDENTVRSWADKGELPATKIGKKWFFPKTVIFHKKSVDDALGILGGDAYVPSTQAFDVLVNNTRVEVKSAKELVRGDGVHYWHFTKFHPVEYSDYYLLLLYNNERTSILKIIYIPSEELKKRMPFISRIKSNSSFEGSNFSISEKDIENLFKEYLKGGE